MFVTEVAEGLSFRRSEHLVQALRNMIAPSYVITDTLLERELATCDVAYLLHDDRGLASVFLVGHHDLTVGQSRRRALYMGLSATRQDLKNTGHVRNLYRSAMSDAAAMEQTLGERLIVWGVTASPSPFYGTHKVWANTQPMFDGTYSRTAGEVAIAIRDYLKLDRTNGHPFVLRRLAKGTRYSQAERDRISAVCAKHRFFLYDELGVDETQGDRLLLVCEVPGELPAEVPV